MTRFEIDFAKLGRSIDKTLLAAHGSVFWLVFAAGERGFPPFDAPLEDAIKRFGMPPNAPLDLWCQCAAIDSQSRDWTGEGLEVPPYAAVAVEVRRARERSDTDAEVGTPPNPVTVVDEPVGPDEAVGKPPNSAGDDGQQRLTGA